MIANGTESGPPRRGHAVAMRANRGLDGIQAWRLTAGFIGAAVVLCLASASFAGRQNSAAAGMQADRQEELARESKAAKDVDVGTFYMHKGDYGAAISRFQDAVQLDPREPKARLLLAESYEKQGDRTHALETYQEYLKAFPNSKDEKTVRKKVAKLARKRE